VAEHRIVIFEQGPTSYYWVLMSSNGRRIAESFHQFTTEEECRKAAKRTKRLMQEAKIGKYREQI